MQGLLDFIKTPEGQGLLSGVFGYAANAQRGTPINNLGRGGLAGVLGYSNAIDREQQTEQNKWQQEYRQLQMDQVRSKIAEEQKKRDWIATQDPTRMALAEGGGPTQANAQKINPGASQAYALLQSGVLSPEEYAKQFILPKERKVKDFKEVRNPDGSVSIVGLTEDGQVVNTNQTPFKAPEVRDFGGYVGGIDPITGKVSRFGDKTLSPDAKASNALGWANYAVSKNRLDFERNKETKPTFNADVGGFVYPPDMRNPEGRVVPIQGAMKPPTEGQGKAVLFGSRMAESNRILSDLEGKGVTPAWTLGVAEKLPLIGGVARAAVNAGPLVTTDEQLYDQAQRDFINAVLRRESGAVIAQEEFDNAAKQYFPKPGDSEEVKAQKRRNREIAIQGLTYEAGPHSRVINNPSPPSGRSGRLPADIQQLLNKY